MEQEIKISIGAEIIRDVKGFCKVFSWLCVVAVIYTTWAVNVEGRAIFWATAPEIASPLAAMDFDTPKKSSKH